MPAYAKITLTHDRLVEFLTYSPKTGVFGWRNGRRSYKPYIGHVSHNGCLYIRIDHKLYLAHRLAWFFVHGAWPTQNVICKDGNYLNLRMQNLRLETQAQTASRMGPRRDNTSGLRGVSQQKNGKWVAMLPIDGKKTNLGAAFATKEEASAAYEKARQREFGQSSAQVDQASRRKALAKQQSKFSALWKRTVKNAGGVVGWVSLEDFIVDLQRSDWRAQHEIVPVDFALPIGPGNWRWEETLFGKFDMTTADGKAAYMRAYHQAYPMLRRARFLQREYGIPLVEYLKLQAKQNGVCACCGQPETAKRNGKVRWLTVDHCHDTGEIRGLLCAKCNLGVGFFDDVPERLEMGAAYLRRHLAKRAAGAVSNVIPLKKPGAS